EEQGDTARAIALAEEALACGPDEHSRAYAAVILAHHTHRQGDRDRSIGLARRGLAVMHEVGDSWGVLVALSVSGHVEAVAGEAARAVRLFGAAQKLGQGFDIPPPPSELERIARSLGLARATLGEAAFERAWAEGQAMTREQVIAFALADDA